MPVVQALEEPLEPAVLDKLLLHLYSVDFTEPFKVDLHSHHGWLPSGSHLVFSLPPPSCRLSPAGLFPSRVLSACCFTLGRAHFSVCIDCEAG